MSGNTKPSIPDTDEGIWGRMKLVPWLRNIEKPHEDPYRDEYPDALRCLAEEGRQAARQDQGGRAAGRVPPPRRRPGRLSRARFVEPERVTLATADYRDKSDPLARFLRLCTELDAKSRVKSSELHAVFKAWCKAAGEKEWSPKGFSDAMIDKGFTKVRSDGMRWEGLRLIRAASDFVDAEGHLRAERSRKGEFRGLPSSEARVSGRSRRSRSG
jgi:phage/plasmid-associated DNA primase